MLEGVGGLCQDDFAIFLENMLSYVDVVLLRSK